MKFKNEMILQHNDRIILKNMYENKF
jgi:hypothetical protein